MTNTFFLTGYMSNSFSLPMTIPDRVQGSACSLSQSPPPSPLGTIPMGIPQSQVGLRSEAIAIVYLQIVWIVCNR